MTEETSFPWDMLWKGALITGLVVPFSLLVSGSIPGPLIVRALGLAALIGIGAWLAYRRGNREMAFGLAGGYGFIALVSAGQCTFYVDQVEDGAVVGFAAYLLTLVASPVIGAIVVAVHRRRRRREGGPQ